MISEWSQQRLFALIECMEWQQELKAKEQFPSKLDCHLFWEQHIDEWFAVILGADYDKE